MIDRATAVQRLVKMNVTVRSAWPDYLQQWGDDHFDDPKSSPTLSGCWQDVVCPRFIAPAVELGHELPDGFYSLIETFAQDGDDEVRDFVEGTVLPTLRASDPNWAQVGPRLGPSSRRLIMRLSAR